MPLPCFGSPVAIDYYSARHRLRTTASKLSSNMNLISSEIEWIFSSTLKPVKAIII